MKQEKRGRGILFPITSEFLFPQLVDRNTHAQVNAQRIFLLEGRGLELSKAIMLLECSLPRVTSAPERVGNSARIPRSRGLAMVVVLWVVSFIWPSMSTGLPLPIHTAYTATFQPEGSWIWFSIIQQFC